MGSERKRVFSYIHGRESWRHSHPSHSTVTRVKSDKVYTHTHTHTQNDKHWYSACGGVGEHLYRHSHEVKDVRTHIHTQTYVHKGTHLNTVHMHTMYTHRNTLSLPMHAHMYRIHIIYI